MIIFNGLTIDYSPQNSGFEKRIESIKISENWNVLMFVTEISSEDIQKNYFFALFVQISL